MREHESPWMRLIQSARRAGLLHRECFDRAHRNPASRYGFALVFAVAALVLRMRTNLEINNDALRMLSVIAVAFAAWQGGFGPGLLATLIGLAGSFFIGPDGLFAVLDVSHLLRSILFGITGIIVSSLTEALTRTKKAWRHAEEAQENRILQERNRMAREIHDTLAQGLTGILIQLEAADDILPHTEKQAEVHAHLSRARDLARVSLAEARRSVTALRPLSLDRQSLPDVLADRIALMTSGTGIEAFFAVEGEPFPLRSDTEDHLLRIGLEAVTNALRHAQTRKVSAVLKFSPGQVTLLVRDEGTGFALDSPQAATGFGLAGMRERAHRIGGDFVLESKPGAGTEICVTVPLSSKSFSPSGWFPA